MPNSLLSNWFLKLRWFAFAGQILVLLLAVNFFELTLPTLNIALILALIPLTNILIFLPVFRQLSPEKVVAGLLLLDTLILTGLLHQSGGPMNPFSIVYLLHVVLAAILLPTLAAWSITALSCLTYGFLFINSKEIPEWHVHGAHHGFDIHLYGMLLAFVVVAILACYFVSKIVAELRKKERQLERFENLAQNQQRLASLTAMTAGAAHELGTPLSTLSVLTGELEHVIKTTGRNDELLADLSVMRQEVSRCKQILQNLSLNSGDVLGEQPNSIALQDLFDNIRQDLSATDLINLTAIKNYTLLAVPIQAITLAFKALVKNALESGTSTAVSISSDFDYHTKTIVIKIVDQGQGMTAEEIIQIGQPFFSTKAPDHGMGLGFYLARLTIEQLGGTIVATSIVGKGTTVIIKLPASYYAQEVAA